MAADTELIVSLIALAVSLIALIIGLLQVFQQYYASAAGYANCGKTVMDLWHQKTQRVFRWGELRFEVQYETPVIFLAPPSNTRGPIVGQMPIPIDGTDKSYQETQTPLNDTEKRDPMSNKELIHTADNELCTWIDLLRAVQAKEKKSAEWSRDMTAKDPPPLGEKHGDRTLTVFLQKKSRSWDTMPSNVKRPYATSTMCHLVELTSILGMHWREFNRSSHRYHAEGNGYIIAGDYVADLGIMFNFQKTGPTRWEDNCIIPVDEIKELCFGYVPTIFRPRNETPAYLKYPSEEPDNLESLQLGTDDEITQTLILLGCKTNTLRFFKNDSGRVSHLFPVVFEVIGMLARVLHIRCNLWRMLPNPTPYRWEKRSFSLHKMLRAFKDNLEAMVNDSDNDNSAFAESKQLANIQASVEAILNKLGSTKTVNMVSIPVLDALHDAIDSMDGYLTRNSGDERTDLVKVVSHVMRHHIQALLDLINEEESPFHELDSLQPEKKQKEFMSIYFHTVRNKVLDGSESDEYMHSYITRVHTLMTTGRRDPSKRKSSLTDSTSTILNNAPQSPTEGRKHIKVVINDIWLTLVFRMICWLMLHDFHKKDVQLQKSELLGSRMPVYIS